MDISIKDFVEELWNTFHKDGQMPKQEQRPADLLHFGHVKGWLEDQDEVYSTAVLDKRTAARILHQYLKIELGRPDAPDITPAQALQDLYTCRVCANHIAQVYVQNLMEAEEVEQNGQILLIFNNLKQVSRKEALNILQKAKTAGINNKA